MVTIELYIQDKKEYLYINKYNNGIVHFMGFLFDSFKLYNLTGIYNPDINEITINESLFNYLTYKLPVW